VSFEEVTTMPNNPKSRVLVTLIGALFVMSPVLGPAGGLTSIDMAVAKDNGGDHGGGGDSHGGGGSNHGGGGGNHGGGGSSGGGNGNHGLTSHWWAPASTAGSTKGLNAGVKTKGLNAGVKLTGPLAATHASATAFEHAAPNSRVGRWLAYYKATVAADSAASLADASNVQALQDAFETSAPQDVIDAYIALQADATDQTLIDAFNQAVADSNLSDDDVAALEQAYTDLQAALAADESVAALQKQADDALLAANNNRPVGDATRALLNQMLADKLNK
jgi:hypothetical protein